MTNATLSLDTCINAQADSALIQPSQFLPILAEAIQDELAFYSHDMNGRITYLSKSAEQVFNHIPDQWLNRRFLDFLTDDPCNTDIRSNGCNESLDSTPSGRVCEIFDRNGTRLRLKYWRVHIVRNGIFVGLAGIVHRLNSNAKETECNCSDEEKELMFRVVGLTEVERQVIDMVVDGNMNKEIAVLLEVAVRTVESRRSRAMMKLQSRTVSELVQKWVQVRHIEASRKREDSSHFSEAAQATF